MKKLILALILVPTFAFASDMTGLWEKQSYDFSTYATDISGRWGDKTYQVDVWSHDLTGNIGDKKVDIMFWDADITGTLPCGQININVWSTQVDGILCGQHFSIITRDLKESKAVAYDTVVSALLAEFPLPAQGKIRHYLDVNHPY